MKPLSLEETKLKEEMKSRCLNQGTYIDENAKEKFKMLCHLEDFEIRYWELQSENQILKNKIALLNIMNEQNYNKYCKLLKENKILRDNAIHNDKVVDITNWQMMLLKAKIKKALEKIQLLIDIGFDYDGFRHASSLMTLIDELVGYAKESKDILEGNKIEKNITNI